MKGVLRPPSRRHRLGAWCAVAIAVPMLAACGETFVDETAPTTLPPDVVETTTTTEPVDPDLPIDVTLDEMAAQMRTLPEQIVQNEGQGPTLERIEALWLVAEPQIRAEDPDELFNFTQAIELARSGVEGRRPADASKGSKILDDVVDAYLDR